MTNEVVHRFKHYEVVYQAPASSDLTCGNGGGQQGHVCQQDVGRAESANKDVSWAACQQGVSHLSEWPDLDQITDCHHTPSCHISHFAFTFHTAPF